MTFELEQRYGQLVPCHLTSAHRRHPQVRTTISQTGGRGRAGDGRAGLSLAMRLIGCFSERPHITCGRVALACVDHGKRPCSENIAEGHRIVVVGKWLVVVRNQYDGFVTSVARDGVHCCSFCAPLNDTTGASSAAQLQQRLAPCTGAAAV